MIGHARRIRLHNLGRPLPGQDDRRHVEAMIGRVELAAHDAQEAAEHYGFAEAAEQVVWALFFLEVAVGKLRRKA